MSDIPSFSYRLPWEERSVHSVANLTTRDGKEFMQLTLEIPVRSRMTTYPLEKANEALNDLREVNFEGSAVLRVGEE